LPIVEAPVRIRPTSFRNVLQAGFASGCRRRDSEFGGYLEARTTTMNTCNAEKGADVTPTLTAGPLTAADRCDRCGAQAYVRATMASGFDLLLCAHHFRENEGRLREVAAAIYDESDRLAEIPATAALEER
jgi:hypothetical protein